MKFGVVLPTFGKDATRLTILDTALTAEKMGFDSVWVTDHLALPKVDSDRFGHIFEAITTLGYLAASTGRIRLGISALVLPQRNPVEVAKELATLDALSSGRVMLAAGIGWSEGEYRNLGYSFKNRGKRMDEALKVLRILWRGGGSASFKGDYYQFEQVVLSPQPVQSGGPPLWVAGDSPEAVRRAVYYADGWHPNQKSPELVRAALSKVQPLIGARPFSVCMRLRVEFGLKTDNLLSGSPDDIRQGFLALREAGVTDAIITFPADTQGVRERSMQQFARDVMPVLASV